jgi:hypothetical protein
MDMNHLSVGRQLRYRQSGTSVVDARLRQLLQIDGDLPTMYMDRWVDKRLPK